jgi:succinyl-CoA synthetase beta subunit
MRFYEFEAKQLLQKHRIPLVQSEVAKTADEAEKIASDIGGPVILKAQTIAPGLSAAAVREASDPAGAKAAATELLGLDDGGRKPNGILVEARPTGEAVYSLSFTYDGTTKRPVVAAANMAGKIDDLGDTHPDRIVRRHFSALNPFSDYIAKELAKSLFLGGNDLKRMTRIVSGLARLFLKYDLADLDITSLVKLGDGNFVVLDVEARRAIGNDPCSTSSALQRTTSGRCVSPPSSSSRVPASMTKIREASSAPSPSSTATSAWSSVPAAAR